MINIDYKDPRPLYEQVSERIKDLILKGILKTDDQLPSVRSLAMDLSINPNTIQRSLSELEREGYVYVIKGRGNFVADTNLLLEEKRKIIRKEIVEKVEEAIGYGVKLDDIVTDISGGVCND